MHDAHNHARDRGGKLEEVNVVERLARFEGTHWLGQSEVSTCIRPVADDSCQCESLRVLQLFEFGAQRGVGLSLCRLNEIIA